MQILKVNFLQCGGKSFIYYFFGVCGDNNAEQRDSVRIQWFLDAFLDFIIC